MILEGILTTLSPEGLLNIAPMGPEIGPDPSMKTFELRPYRSSTTYQNLKARGEGVFHVTDDVLLLAQTAIGVPLIPAPSCVPPVWSPAGFSAEPAVITSSASRTSMTGRTAPGSPSRLSPRADYEISWVSTAPGMRWWKRPSSPPGRRFCREPRS